MCNSTPPTEQQEGKGPNNDDDEKFKVLQKVKDRMKNRGIDKATARQILRVWKENGITDSQQLRKVLADNSMRRARFIAGQLLFDGFVVLFSLYTAGAIGRSGGLGPLWSLPAEYLLYFLAFYFGIGCLFNLTTLSTTAMMTQQYNSTADEVLQAMQELADQQPGVARSGNVLEAGRQAVDAIKVAGALQQISALLKDKLEQDGKV